MRMWVCDGCGQELWPDAEPGHTVLEIDGRKEYHCRDCFGWLLGVDIHWESPDGPEIPPDQMRRIL